MKPPAKLSPSPKASGPTLKPHKNYAASKTHGKISSPISQIASISLRTKQQTSSPSFTPQAMATNVSPAQTCSPTSSTSQRLNKPLYTVSASPMPWNVSVGSVIQVAASPSTTCQSADISAQ